MNISSDEDSSLDVTVDRDIFGKMYHLTFKINHDITGIHEFKYSLPDNDIEYLIEYLQYKLK